ncbi:BTAD domain-containing putative transcriptional regulator [Streptomyces sp. NPDC018693]|uniref:BTAD domain-containing putative transcriptional regulator n=1 Tax=unclassified Streptomyces TaxID=2593676 RepID=UPI003798DC42
MHVGILGPLEVVTEDGAVDIGGARLRVLLTRLALDAGRVVTVDALVRAVWPQGGPVDPANALQTLVSRFRRTLPPYAETMRWTSGGYRLDLPPDAVDALRFERLTTGARHLLGSGQPSPAARQLSDALALWRGDALAGLLDHPFAAAAAARLEELRIAAVEDHTDAVLAAGQADAPENCGLLAELEEHVTAHPLRERLRALQMRALCEAGRHTEALAVYEDFRKMLAAELGTGPGAQVRAAHLAALHGERDVSPGPPPPTQAVSRQPPRNGLRASLTSFVGRAAELAAVKARLREGRLVTLTGPGGSGKTRLAGICAMDLAGSFPGGVRVVELAAVDDPGDLPRAVHTALGLRDPGLAAVSATPRDAVTGLVEALSAAETLLVLDNCEHQVPAVAELCDELLARCAQLRILATSRESLGMLGESLCPVPPLPVPPASAAPSGILACPAVQLFADRAAAVRPDFRVTEDNAGVVAEICRRLDGLPLAIELAAARLRALPAEELAARLDDRFRLLTGGNRSALPRHRTLRAVVDWSWHLLDEDQRHCLRRLAVFPAGITPASAAAVCGGEGRGSDAVGAGASGDATGAGAGCDAVGAGASSDAGGTPASGGLDLDVLTGLVDKSLLQVVPGHEARYRMLETIRAYAARRLAEQGGTTAAKDAHATYFLALAEQAEPRLCGPDQLPHLHRLSAERDNLVAALNHACETRSAETAVRLGAALGFFWTVQGNHAEAASRLRLTLELPGARRHPAWTVGAAFWLLNMVLSGEAGLTAAERLAAEVREHLESPEHSGPAASPPDKATAQAAPDPVAAVALASLALLSGDIPLGLTAVDRCLPDSAPWFRGVLFLLRAFLRGTLDGLHSANHDMAAAVEAFRTAGERWGQATSLTYLAFIRANLDDENGTASALEQSITLLGELGTADVLQRVWLAESRARKGDTDRARALLLDVLSGESTAPRPLSLVALGRVTLGNLLRLEGELTEAERQFAFAEGDLDRLPSPYLAFRAMLACGRGRLLVERGDLTTAARQLSAAVAQASAASQLTVVAMAAVGLASLQWRRRRADGAARTLGAAHALRGAPDDGNPDVARLAGALRTELGPHAYDTAYAHGSGLSRSAALDLIQDLARTTALDGEHHDPFGPYPSLP